MNIEYTPEQIEALEAIRDQIHRQSVLARDANQEILRLTQQLASLNTRAASEHCQRQIAKPKPPAP